MPGLREFPAGAVLRADDLARVKDFYENVLGLDAVSSDETLTSEVQFLAGAGTHINIYARPGMPAPENTTLGFTIPIDEFDRTVEELRKAGVVFEEYDMPEIGLKTVGGIAETGGGKAAWFKDTEGNIVILSSE